MLQSQYVVCILVELVVNDLECACLNHGIENAYLRPDLLDDHRRPVMPILAMKRNDDSTALLQCLLGIGNCKLRSSATESQTRSGANELLKTMNFSVSSSERYALTT